MSQAAESILTICQKKQLTKQDKTRLLKLHDKIVQTIETLKECDSCNSIDAIATITLNGMTANLCKECGIKALQVGKIEKKRKHPKTETSQHIDKMNQGENSIASVKGVGPIFEEELKSINICTDIELIRRIESTGAPQIIEEIKKNKQDVRLSVQRLENIYQHAKAKYSLTSK
jgi:hypothetical protein